MRFLTPAASVVLIAAVALSATAAVPAAGAQSARTNSAQTRSQRPVLPRTAATGAETTTPSGALTASADTNRAPVAPLSAYGWPLSPRPAVVRRFELPRDQWSPGHRGVDLLADVGQPVLSAGDGVVAYSGVLAGRGVVTVRHSGGLRTTYEPVDERLSAGTLVHRGTRIGVVSSVPGHCVPRHCLHWGAISGQAYRDPLSLLSFGRPILLPLG
jgi:murein DD-endopeptidase MepM/ murein hydrolase activator NlpD